MIVAKNLYSNSDLYWIQKIDSKYFVRNQYVDVQYCKVYLQQNYYKLRFNLVFYISNNFFLPANSITTKIVGPTFEVNDIPLIKSNDTINNSIENLQYDTISVYKTMFEIDISNDPFFQGTSNKSFDLNISFDFDTSQLNKENSSIESQTFETFISELLNSSFDIRIMNNSYIFIPNKGIYNHVFAYENDNLNNSFVHSKKVKFDFQNFSSVDYSIKKLFNFEVIDGTNNLTISNVHLKLHYKYDEIDKMAELKFDTESDYLSNNLSFVLNNYETYFDKSKNEIIFQNGNKGIFFPFNTNGFYEISFILIINNKPITYNLRNNFSYVYQQNKANFIVEPFFDELIEYEEITYKE